MTLIPTCRWCGVELDQRKIPWRVWDNRMECVAVVACERRRVQRQVQAALARRSD